MTGEAAFLDWVRARCPAAGDDLAILSKNPGPALLAGVDPVLDGVHIDTARDGYEAAGRKAVNRNLSDLAAMGGEPTGLLLALAIPKSLTLNQVQKIFLAAEAAGKAFNCPIVGGDFATWDGPLAITVTVVGYADRPVPRTGATPGQTLFVTGPLGGSILGRHHRFTPRLDYSKSLLQQRDTIHLSAMMDLSDGLSRDLPRLLDGLGATLIADDIPLHDDARQLAVTTGRETLWHALHDGEDYELLFAADQAPEGVPAFPIGKVTDGPLQVQSEDQFLPLDPLGWEHKLGS